MSLLPRPAFRTGSLTTYPALRTARACAGVERAPAALGIERRRHPGSADARCAAAATRPEYEDAREQRERYKGGRDLGPTNPCRASALRTWRSHVPLIYVEAVRLTGGAGHEHITDVAWKNPDTGATGQSSQTEMVRWVRSGGEAYVVDAAGQSVKVAVVDAAPPHIRTVADGILADDLLALPRY